MIDDPNDSWWGNRMNYMVTYELPSVEMIVASDVYNTTMTLTKDGPDYNGLYDAAGHQNVVIEYTDEILEIGGVICRR